MDSGQVDQLAKGTKKSVLESYEGLTVSLYDLDDKEVRVAELCGAAELGETRSIICLQPRVGDKLYISSTQVVDILASQRAYSLPTFEGSIASVFDKALHRDLDIYYVINTSCLASSFPSLLAGVEDEGFGASQVEPELQISLRSRHWLTYVLSFVLSTSKTGVLKLRGHETDSIIGFTSGHPTFALYEDSTGVEALQNIGSYDRWVSHVWSEAECSESHNITETAESLIAALKKTA